MKEFNNFNSFADFFTRKLNKKKFEVYAEYEKALIPVCEFLQEKAKEKFGVYQTDWKQLTPATQKGRVRLGYTPNDPLLRSGDLRDSVEYSILGNSAVVGSKNEIMLYQEKGTSTIPPRPVFLIVHQNHGKEAVEIFVSYIFKGFKL